ncbi:phage portal protein [Staphylococcus agnetis]|uniref:phage portal protein n=1 Tax=Staphylococcus agnetis TaxID=985762 RepID=UPI00071F53A7|nr:phage portal protein [Staphylococcus agnetis]ALN76061.1 phage portal protein [Staphylococcus agnetis]NJI12032.1 phage portal protein [Staphylococcus agnetis]
MALFEFASNKEPFNEDLRRILYAEQHGTNISYSGINALKNSDVFTAIKVIAGDVASTDIMTKGHHQDNIFNMILKLFNESPDGELPGWHFKFIIIANLLINGNAYVEIGRDKKTGLPISLHFLHNSLVSLEEKDNNLIYNISEDYEGNAVKVTPDDILHFRYMTLDGYHGYSPLYSLMHEVSISQGSKSFLKHFFENGGTTTNVLTLEDAKLSQDERDSITDQFERSLARNNSGIITLDSTMKFDRISIPTEALNFLNSYKFSTQQVAKAFGLPLSKMSSELVNTSITQANVEYLQSTLYPLFSMIFAELKLKIFNEINPLMEFTFDESRLIDSDPEVKLKKYTELHQKGFISTDEGRSVFGFQPVQNGDKLLVDLNRIPLDSLEEYQRAKIAKEISKPTEGGEAYGEQ